MVLIGVLIDIARWLLYIGAGYYIAYSNNLQSPFLIGIVIAIVLDYCSEDWSDLLDNTK